MKGDGVVPNFAPRRQVDGWMDGDGGDGVACIE